MKNLWKRRGSRKTAIFLHFFWFFDNSSKTMHFYEKINDTFIKVQYMCDIFILEPPLFVFWCSRYSFLKIGKFFQNL